MRIVNTPIVIKIRKYHQGLRVFRQEVRGRNYTVKTNEETTVAIGQAKNHSTKQLTTIYHFKKLTVST